MTKIEKTRIVSGFSFMVICLTIAAVLDLAPACTKAQEVAVANSVVQVAVGLCQEAPQIVPAGAQGVTGLLCTALGSGQAVEVLIDSAIWNSMKADAAKKAWDR